MDSFSCNSAKSYVGKRVNLHLKDGTVLVNVLIEAIEEKRFAKYRVGASRRLQSVELKKVSYAQDVPTLLMEAC